MPTRADGVAAEVQEVVEQTRALARLEVELATAELRQKASSLAAGADGHSGRARSRPLRRRVPAGHDRGGAGDRPRDVARPPARRRRPPACGWRDGGHRGRAHSPRHAARAGAGARGGAPRGRGAAGERPWLRPAHQRSSGTRSRSSGKRSPAPWSGSAGSSPTPRTCDARSAREHASSRPRRSQPGSCSPAVSARRRATSRGRCANTADHGRLRAGAGGEGLPHATARAWRAEARRPVPPRLDAPRLARGLPARRQGDARRRPPDGGLGARVQLVLRDPGDTAARGRGLLARRSPGHDRGSHDPLRHVHADGGDRAPRGQPATDGGALVHGRPRHDRRLRPRALGLDERHDDVHGRAEPGVRPRGRTPFCEEAAGRARDGRRDRRGHGARRPAPRVRALHPPLAGRRPRGGRRALLGLVDGAVADPRGRPACGVRRPPLLRARHPAPALAVRDTRVARRRRRLARRLERLLGVREHVRLLQQGLGLALGGHRDTDLALAHRARAPLRGRGERRGRAQPRAAPGPRGEERVVAPRRSDSAE